MDIPSLAHPSDADAIQRGRHNPGRHTRKETGRLWDWQVGILKISGLKGVCSKFSERGYPLSQQM